MGLLLAAAVGAAALSGCPHDASLGTVTFPRAKAQHAVSLATCEDRVVPRPKPARRAKLVSRTGQLAAVRARRSPDRRFGSQAITVDGRAIYSVNEDYHSIPGGTPGPLGLVGWSPNGRWLFFYLDPMGSASIIADGIRLQALSVPDGRVVPVTTVLRTRDYMTWCGSTLVLAAGADRIATHDKRLVVARAPAWRPRPLWADPRRAVSSVACAPNGRSIAVLSQRASTEADFLDTHWQLWRVGLDGSRTLLDSPPAGWADVSPRWSRDGRALLFVRQHKGHGQLMLWRAGQVTGPIADVGYRLGYYGYQDWWDKMSWSAGA